MFDPEIDKRIFTPSHVSAAAARAIQDESVPVRSTKQVADSIRTGVAVLSFLSRHIGWLQRRRVHKAIKILEEIAGVVDGQV